MAFEMGYMTSTKKPVFAYYEAKPLYGKVARQYPLSKEQLGFDVHGQSIKNFKMIGSLEIGENKISQNFESAIMAATEMIKNRKD